MRARDRDAALQPRYLRQEVPAAQHRPCRRRNLGVVVGDGGRHDDLGARRHVRDVVADDRLDPRLAQRPHIARLRSVGAGDLGTERGRRQRETAHSGAPDADEVQPAAAPGLRIHGAKKLAAPAAVRESTGHPGTGRVPNRTTERT